MHKKCVLKGNILLLMIVITIGAITNCLIESIIYEIIMILYIFIKKDYYRFYSLVHIGLFLIGINTMNLFDFDLYVFIVVQGWGFIISCISRPFLKNNFSLDHQQRIYNKFFIIYNLIYLLILNIFYYYDNQYINIILYIYVVIHLEAVIQEIGYQFF